MTYKILMKRGPSNSWITPVDYLLADGQQGLDTTLMKTKIGNGKTTWSQLPFENQVFREFTFIINRGQQITLGSNKTNAIIIPSNMIITKCYAHVTIAPTGSNLIFDINKNGTSIWNITSANKISIAAGNNSGNQVSFDTINLVEGDLLTIDVDQIGSIVSGSDATILLKCTVV